MAEQRRQQVPWKDPETWQSPIWTTGWGVFLGTALRVLEQHLLGERERFWTGRLIVDAVGLVVMIVISAGLAEYMDLGPWATSAVAVVLGRGGPPLIDRIFERLSVTVRKGA